MDLTFSVADTNGNGTSIRNDGRPVCCRVGYIVDYIIICTWEEIKVMNGIVYQVLGKDASQEEVEKMIERTSQIHVILLLGHGPEGPRHRSQAT